MCDSYTYISAESPILCKMHSHWSSSLTPNFSAARPAVSDTEKWAHLHVRTCRCTPPMTCVICIVAWSLNTHQILSPSAHPFLSYGLAANFNTPSLCTCHVPRWLPRWMGVSSIHDRKNVATHERKLLFDEPLFSKRQAGACTAPAGN